MHHLISPDNKNADKKSIKKQFKKCRIPHPLFVLAAGVVAAFDWPILALSSSEVLLLTCAEGRFLATVVDIVPSNFGCNT